MTTITIIGPGAIGGTVAAWLSQDPRFSVSICARTPLDDLVVETPQGTITAQPRVLTDPELAEPVDWVLVCTKTYQSEGTRPWLDRLVGQGTRVAVVQNGVEQVELFRHLVPVEQLLPVIINLPASRHAPGRIVQKRHGVIDVPAGRDGEDFAALFENTEIEAEAAEDFVSRAWIKLTNNCWTIVPALTLRGTGAAWNDDLETIVRGVIEECAAVGRAEGATIAQSFVEHLVATAKAMPDGQAGSSIHADRLAGNPMEIDARNGVIVRRGRAHGIPTPMNQLLVTLLRASGSPWVK
jgi:2-dehydropantoate 2-reductase